jgi:threonine/homoserine/homoserine lactone efflux protein
MFGTHDLALFIASGLLLNIAPGPDTFLILNRSASGGWRAGVATAFGIGAGTFVHVFAAAFGLSAILVTSAAAFTIVKLVGAAYLFYLGVSLLRSRQQAATYATTSLPMLSLRGAFAQGFLTNVLNPKVALFFLAFVPQFIARDATSKLLAFVFLGTLFNFNGMLWANFLAFSAATLSRRIKTNRVLTTWFNRAVGSLFVGLGLKLALSDQR